MIVACDHIEKLNAKSKPIERAAVDVRPRQRFKASPSIQRVELEKSIVPTVTASAPQTLLNKLISHAALPSGSN